MNVCCTNVLRMNSILTILKCNKTSFPQKLPPACDSAKQLYTGLNSSLAKFFNMPKCTYIKALKQVLKLVAITAWKVIMYVYFTKLLISQKWNQQKNSITMFKFNEPWNNNEMFNEPWNYNQIPSLTNHVIIKCLSLINHGITSVIGIMILWYLWTRFLYEFHNMCMYYNKMILRSTQ